MNIKGMMQEKIGNIIDYAGKEKEELQVKLMILNQINKWKKDNQDLNPMQILESAKLLIPKDERLITVKDLEDLNMSIKQTGSNITMCDNAIKMWQEVLTTEI